MNKRLLILLIPVIILLIGICEVSATTLRNSKHISETVQAVSNDDYPPVWKNEKLDSMFDSWGNAIKECTSWAAWKVWQEYHVTTNDWGNANQWVDSATKYRKTAGNTPQKGSVAVDTSFSPGHVMWVDEVYDDGYIKVSEYNYKPGEYSERLIKAEGLDYVYFKQ